MNCKQDQLAWINVPAWYNGSGIDEMQGHVVKAVRLLPFGGEATWVVSPAQSIRFRMAGTDRFGKRTVPGDVLLADGIPDAWLRPFDPKAEPADEGEPAVLELAA